MLMHANVQRLFFTLETEVKKTIWPQDQFGLVAIVELQILRLKLEENEKENPI